MKFMGVREAQAHLSGLVEASQSERVVLTRHGRPVALLTGVEGKDLEEVLLLQDPEFQALIQERRAHRGPLVSHQSLVEKARRDLARAGRRTTRSRRTRGRQRGE